MCERTSLLCTTSEPLSTTLFTGSSTILLQSRKIVSPGLVGFWETKKITISFPLKLPITDDDIIKYAG